MDTSQTNRHNKLTVISLCRVRVMWFEYFWNLSTFYQHREDEKGNSSISPIWVEAPRGRSQSKKLRYDVHNVIMCAKFQSEILGSYNFTEGRISHLAIDF